MAAIESERKMRVTEVLAARKKLTTSGHPKWSFFTSLHFFAIGPQNPPGRTCRKNSSSCFSSTGFVRNVTKSQITVQSPSVITNLTA